MLAALRLLPGSVPRSLRSLRPAMMSSSSSGAPVMRVWPERCLFDEPLRLAVSGLAPGQEVALRTELSDDSGELFTSLALYRAGSSGELELSRSPALEGGSFSGTEPEGPLWSLQHSSQPPLRRLIKRHVTPPFQLRFSLLQQQPPHQQQHQQGGALLLQQQPHHQQGGALLIATAAQERAFLGEGVSRVPVREGAVRATLFLPPGPGPFPGVIEIQGTGGGLLEYKASLLASKGFATLALAYYNYEDLPKKMKDLRLEYFEEALNYMLQHPKVKGPGIGLLGHSKGGDLVLSMASFLKGITAVAVVNGSVANMAAALHYKDITLPPIGYDPSKALYPSTGVMDIREVFNNPLEEANRRSLIPVGRADCKFLFIVAGDDGNYRSDFYAQTACQLLEEQGKEKPEVVYYPNAGHYIEPPYFPLCKVSIHKLVGLPCVWGGEPKAHSAAQVDSWNRIQAFFHTHLNQKVISSHL